MNNETWGKIALVLVVVIFGSSAVIWTYNKIQGHDLSEPPNFDLSAYDELQWPDPDQVFNQSQPATEETDNQEQPAKEPSVDQLVAKVEQRLDTLNQDDFELRPNYIYFKKYFKGQTAKETQSLISNFIKDFPDLQTYKIDDFLAQKCYQVELPVEGREELLSLLELSEAIEKVEAATLGAPQYNLCFFQGVYLNEVSDFLLDYPAIKVLSDEQPIPEYIAAIDYGNDADKIAATINKLKNDYSDVVTVAE